MDGGAFRIVAGLFLAALAMTACGAADVPGDTTAFEGNGFRVTVPDGWQALATEPASWRGGQTVAFISNQALDPQCDGPGVSNCHAPVEALDEGSQLVWWITTTCAGATCELPDGERLLVGGREARRIGDTDVCDSLRATAEVAYVVAVSPQRLDAIVACDHDASASVQQQLQALIDSVDWRTP